MKFIETVDEDGFKRRWAINDEDDPAEVEEIGLYVGVPDLSEIDWEGMQMNVHNQLHDMGIFTGDDILANSSLVVSVAKVVLVREITKIYGV